MTTKRVLLIVALIVLAVGLGLGAQRQIQKRFKQPAFTLFTRVTHLHPQDSNRNSHGDETRYAYSDGSYRVTYKGERGEAREYFFKRGLGFFEVNHHARQLIRNRAMAPDAGGTRQQTAEEMLSDPQFLRTEKVLGLTAYVIRVKDEQTGTPITDMYFAVETGKTPLKTIDYDGNGAPLTIAEPVRIIFGEPDPALIDVPAYQMVEGASK